MLYDCFTFFNELDLLDIRLNTLDEVVDRFVIVEARKTFKGDPRDLVFLPNKDRYKKFASKIIYVIVGDLPDGDNAWAREAHQRNAILRGLTNCKQGDYIMVSDVDEIPRPEAVKKAVQLDDVTILLQDFFYYYLNCKGDEVWRGTRVVPAEKMMPPQVLRHSGKYAIKDAGWHFSYQGGVEAIVKKIDAFSHQEFNNDYFKDPARIEKAMLEGKDLFGRSNKWWFVDIDETYPNYIRENQDKLSKMIFSK